MHTSRFALGFFNDRLGQVTDKRFYIEVVLSTKKAQQGRRFAVLILDVQKTNSPPDS